MADELGGPPPGPPDPTTTPPAATAAPATAVESRPATWHDVIDYEAKRQGVDPRLVHAVANTESSYNPDAHSPAGAHGIMQLMPATAAKWGVDPKDPVQNIRGGVSELKALLDEHQGDVTMALRRYNGSPQASEAATQPYVDKVLGQIGGKKSAAATPATVAAKQPTPGEDPAAPPPTLPPTVGQPPPTTPTAPEGWTAWGIRHAKEFASSFDPRTQTGRQNIAGGVGGAIGGAMGLGAAAPTAVVTGPVGPAAGATAGAIAGSAAGGAIENEGENLYHQIVGDAPPSTSSALAAAGTGGLTQGTQEAVGHGLMWPVQAVGRRFIAGRVGRYATEALSQTKSYTLGKLSEALDAATDLLRTTKAGAREANAQTATSTRQAVTDAANRARQGVQAASTKGEEQQAGAATIAAGRSANAEGAAVSGEAAATAPYSKLVGTPPPDAAEAGRLANTMIQTGAAAKARNLAGQAVDAAAASGPDVDITALKAEAQKVIEGQVRPPETSFPRKAGDAGVTDEAVTAQTGIAPERVAEMRANAAAGDPRATANLKLLSDAVSSAQGEAGQETLKHPAMAVLQRIMNAGDTVPFKDAHLWKVELDNSIRNTRDQTVKSQVAALTQKFTGSLRGALKAAGHQPYEDATAAYAKIAPLYTTELAPRLKKLAVGNPEAIVPLLTVGQPTRARMFVDLMTHQAEAGGDAEGGQAVLEAVQSAWVRKKIIDGGIDKLSDRIDKVPAAFRDAFLGDPKAKAVLANLKLIHTAYKTAILTGEQGVEAATAANVGGKSAVADLAAQRTGAAREAGQQAVQSVRQRGEGIRTQTRQTGAAPVEQAAQGVRPARQALAAGKADIGAQEQALGSSSLASAIRPEAGIRAGADLLRSAAMLSTGVGGITHSYYGGLSLMRLLHGATANDLVHYAATSPALTRAFVKIITSQAPAEGLAAMVRSSGILDEGPQQPASDKAKQKKAAPPIGAPPPPQSPIPTAAAGIGTPPPA